MADLTAIILTYNEELHIERCLAALKLVCSRIVVVDSFSNDRTVELVRAKNVELLQHVFVNQADQFQWALDNAGITSSWVMRLDADEVFDAELAEEITETIASLPPDVTGICLKRRQYFLGEFVRYGGRYPLILLRIWRNGCGRVEQRWMDEHIVLDHGEIVTLKHDFRDDSLRNVAWWSEKHIRYATREAVDVLIRRHRLFESGDGLGSQHGSAQARQRRAFKEGFYNRLPFLLGPVLYFLYRFIILGGFLDGKGGRAYHVLQGFWYRVLVDVRVLELDRILNDCPDVASRIKALERETKLPVREFAAKSTVRSVA